MAGGYEAAFIVNATLGLIAGAALWLANLERSQVRSPGQAAIDRRHSTPAPVVGD
jgi:hypothetical protein